MLDNQACTDHKTVRLPLYDAEDKIRKSTMRSAILMAFRNFSSFNADITLLNLLL
jgi:hypothetical protein